MIECKYCGSTLFNPCNAFDKNGNKIIVYKCTYCGYLNEEEYNMDDLKPISK